MEALFFAKLFGLYFIIVGAIVLARRKAVMPTVSEMANSRALMLVLAAIEIAAGLAIVLAYPMVGVDMNGIVSLVGYMLLIEGIIYLAAPAAFMRRFIGMFNKPVFYVGGGALAIVAGIYLAAVGFGYMPM